MLWTDIRRSGSPAACGLLQRPLIKSIYAYMKDKRAASAAMIPVTTNPAACNCLALRQAARHVTQFYDQSLARSGLRATQYSILARLQRNGPMTINALAAELVMDRTTLGRNILPLQRDGLIAVGPGKSDRRRKELRLTGSGGARFRTALNAWQQAQARFEAEFGVDRAKELRALLQQVVSNDASGGDGLHA
jgi:DNA-binding MarR family transcriptional regulator